MCHPSQSDMLLIRRIREGDAEAWAELIDRFEGRLLAFVQGRTRDRNAAEDVVQETFIGLLTSLPNYDSRRPLESYLFSIAAHKLTDLLRREGRRPTVPLMPPGESTSGWQPQGYQRGPSSLARSAERHHLEDAALVAAMRKQIDHCRRRGQWEKLQCAELLFVRGLSNKETAAVLDLSEQTVANHKYEFLAKLRASVRAGDLPREVFPELYE